MSFNLWVIYGCIYHGGFWMRLFTKHGIQFSKTRLFSDRLNKRPMIFGYTIRFYK
jgi:hypothetical protein